RMGTDRCGQLWSQRARASALPLVPRRFGTAILFPGAPVCAPSHARTKAIARELRQHAPPRWLPPPMGVAQQVEELAAGRRLAALRLPPALARGRDTARFRFQCASSFLRKGLMVLSLNNRTYLFAYN